MSKKSPRMAAGALAAADALAAELRPGQSIELLKELHILTREGRLNQDSRRKLKQVYHLFQFIEPLLQTLSQDVHAPTLADHGAGFSNGVAWSAPNANQRWGMRLARKPGNIGIPS